MADFTIDNELFTFTKKCSDGLHEFQLRYTKSAKLFYFTIFRNNEYEFWADWDNSRDRVIGSDLIIRELLWNQIEVLKNKSIARWTPIRINYLIQKVYGILDQDSNQYKQLYTVGKKAKPSMFYKCLVKLHENNII